MSALERIVIKAAAGTGKTFRLVQEYGNALGLGESTLHGGACSPEEIIAVTFTRKAAAELRDRVRRKLHRAGRSDLAEKAEGAFIGTVDSICLRLIQEYALDAGFSPFLRELAEEDGRSLLNISFVNTPAEMLRVAFRELAVAKIIPPSMRPSIPAGMASLHMSR